MAQHAVAKVTGTVDGVMLVTGVLAPQEHPALALANCAVHLLRISRQVRMLRCSSIGTAVRRPQATALEGFAGLCAIAYANQFAMVRVLEPVKGPLPAIEESAWARQQ